LRTRKGIDCSGGRLTSPLGRRRDGYMARGAQLYSTTIYVHIRAAAVQKYTTRNTEIYISEIYL
jgi:hypothetical protein